MRVLMVSNTYLPHLNGQAVFAGSLAEGLAASGHQVKVLVPGIDREPGQVLNGVEIVATPAVDLRFIHKEFFISWRYRSVVREMFEIYQPEIVHLQDPAPLSQMVLKEARKHHIPVVCTHHPGPAIWAPYLSEHDPFVKHLIVPVIWGWVISYLNQADFVTVPSHASVRMLVQHGLKVPTSAISCGVPVGQLREATTQTNCEQNLTNQAKKKFLYVGRIDEEKRVDVLLKAMAQVSQEKAELIVAGGGSLESEMHHLAEQLHTESRVRFLGKVNHQDLPALYQSSDVFIMPGDVESLSIATLEAMACGKPIIAANAMALPELVKNGKNGFLFHPRDPKDLAQKIDQMCIIDQQWSVMGKNSLELVQRHDLKLTIRRYQDLYQKMIQQNIGKKHVPVWVRLPLTLLNPYAVLVVGQWAATVIIILISLFSRSTPVSAASLSNVDLITPEMMETLQQLLTAIRHIDFTPNQAVGMFSLNAGIHHLLTTFGD